jgi:hypothetical protein
MAGSRRNLIAAVAVLAAAYLMTGCAAAPLNKPIEGGPVSTGAGSLEATRKALEGTWSLVSFETVDPRGARRMVMASGRLQYDGFGNMNIRGVIEDPAVRSSIVLDYTGRIVIDPVKHEFRPAALETDRPVEPGQIEAVSPDKVRRYELMGDAFVVTYLDTSAAPTAIARWRRTSAPAAPTPAR